MVGTRSRAPATQGQPSDARERGVELDSDIEMTPAETPTEAPSAAMEGGGASTADETTSPSRPRRSSTRTSLERLARPARGGIGGSAGSGEGTQDHSSSPPATGARQRTSARTSLERLPLPPAPVTGATASASPLRRSTRGSAPGRAVAATATRRSNAELNALLGRDAAVREIEIHSHEESGPRPWLADVREVYQFCFTLGTSSTAMLPWL